jgi:predicted sulfurtransferase
MARPGHESRTNTFLVAALLMGIVAIVLAACSIGRIFPDVTAEQLKSKMDTEARMLVIDLRGEEEYRMGRIPKAINVAPNKLHLLKDVLPEDKNTPIVFYCRGSG